MLIIVLTLDLSGAERTRHVQVTECQASECGDFIDIPVRPLNEILKNGQ